MHKNERDNNNKKMSTTKDSETLLSTRSIGQIFSTSEGKSRFKPNSTSKSKVYSNLLSLVKDDSYSTSSDDDDSGDGALAFAASKFRNSSSSFMSLPEYGRHKGLLDVHERQGFDVIFNTVAGVADDTDDEAIRISDALRLLNDLLTRDSMNRLTETELSSKPLENGIPGNKKHGKSKSEKIAWMIYCQSGSRFKNDKFQELTEKFIDHERIHIVINDMQSELSSALSNQSIQKTITRSFTLSKGCKEILHLSASFLKKSSSNILFVADVEQLISM